MTREQARPLRPRVTDAWDALLATVVQESVRRGALPTTWDLAADGTGLVSGAHSFGRTICACPGRRCRCRRYFSDPTALLGWDSHRHRYFFGHCAQALVVANPVPGQPAHPLVVSVALHPAHRHDGVAYPDLLRKTQARYAGAGVTLRRVLADAAYDVAGLWAFTRTCGLTPVFAPHPPADPARPESRRDGGGVAPGGGSPPDLRGGAPAGAPRPATPGDPDRGLPGPEPPRGALSHPVCQSPGAGDGEPPGHPVRGPWRAVRVADLAPDLCATHGGRAGEPPVGERRREDGAPPAPVSMVRAAGDRGHRGTREGVGARAGVTPSGAGPALHRAAQRDRRDPEHGVRRRRPPQAPPGP